MGGIGDTVRELLGKTRPSLPPDGATTPPGVDSAASNPDLAALKKEAGKGGKRGRKVGPDEALAAAQLQSAIDELYTAENWDEIGALYFETRYALTGFEGFRLSEKQRRVISTSLAMTMKTLAITDPKWIALTIFAVNFGGLVAQKEMQYAKTVAAETRARNGDRV
jgi:hypothetical protein